MSESCSECGGVVESKIYEKYPVCESCEHEGGRMSELLQEILKRLKESQDKTLQWAESQDEKLGIIEAYDDAKRVIEDVFNRRAQDE